MHSHAGVLSVLYDILCAPTFLRPKQQTRMSSFCMTLILASSTCGD